MFLLSLSHYYYYHFFLGVVTERLKVTERSWYSGCAGGYADIHSDLNHPYSPNNVWSLSPNVTNILDFQSHDLQFSQLE